MRVVHYVSYLIKTLMTEPCARRRLHSASAIREPHDTNRLTYMPWLLDSTLRLARLFNLVASKASQALRPITAPRISFPSHLSGQLLVYRASSVY
jgi:hypothetical protein